MYCARRREVAGGGRAVGEEVEERGREGGVRLAILGRSLFFFGGFAIPANFADFSICTSLMGLRLGLCASISHDKAWHCG